MDNSFSKFVAAVYAAFARNPALTAGAASVGAILAARYGLDLKDGDFTTVVTSLAGMTAVLVHSSHASEGSEHRGPGAPGDNGGTAAVVVPPTVPTPPTPATPPTDHVLVPPVVLVVPTAPVAPVAPEAAPELAPDGPALISA